uniref:tryptophan--tRNA ligase n=1 Tax=Babesia bovis TaxID=5865 RepID=S6B1U7_BABBO|nr:tRNA synthetases class I (W and Y) family protein [Babesia bovis]
MSGTLGYDFRHGTWLLFASYLFWLTPLIDDCYCTRIRGIHDRKSGFVQSTGISNHLRRSAVYSAIAGIQPTGDLHIGNYIGGIKPAVEYQTAGGALNVLIADLHATTEHNTTVNLSDSIRRTVATLLSCGVDPDRSAIILQSDFPEILELHWILSTVISIGRLRKLANFEHRQVAQDGDSVAEFLYPLLMAADVLCSGSDSIIAGEDQLSHVCVIREVAKKLNRLAGSTVVCIPDMLPNTGFRVISLDGRGKMSKSSLQACSRINITDTEETIYQKIKVAKTSTDDTSSTEVTNLRRLLKFFSGDSGANIPGDIQFSLLKEHLHQVVTTYPRPIRQRYNEILLDDTAVSSALKSGRTRMQPTFASI